MKRPSRKVRQRVRRTLTLLKIAVAMIVIRSAVNQIRSPALRRYYKNLIGL